MDNVKGWGVVITADLVTAGQGLHARPVGPAHHALLLLTTGSLLVLTIDFTKEIVLHKEDYACVTV